MHRRTFLAAAATGAVGSLAGCGGSPGLAESEYDIGMSVNRFTPETHRVRVDQEVVWGNTSSRPHTVTAYEGEIPESASYFASGGFESQSAAVGAWPNGGDVQPGETYTHRFAVPGEYHYFCIPHEAAGMVGTVVVE